MIKFLIDNMSNVELQRVLHLFGSNMPRLVELFEIPEHRLTPPSIKEPIVSEEILQGKKEKFEEEKNQSHENNQGKDYQELPTDQYGAVFLAALTTSLGLGVPILREALISEKEMLHTIGTLNNFLKGSGMTIQEGLNKIPQNVDYLCRKIRVYEEVSDLVQKLENQARVPEPKTDFHLRKKFRDQQVQWLSEGQGLEKVLLAEKDEVDRDSMNNGCVQKALLEGRKKIEVSTFMKEIGTDLSIKGALD